MEEEEEARDACAQAYNLALGMVPCMATRAACELGIPDILREGPLSASQIAHNLSLSSPAHRLDRLLRFLCTHGVFKASPSSHPITYSLTPLSTWLAKPANPESTFPRTSPHTSLADNPSHDMRIPSQAPPDTAITPNDASSALDLFLLFTSPLMQPPWQYLAQFISHGEQEPFSRAYGMDLWTFQNSNPNFNHLFTTAMACDSRISMEVLFKHYDGFKDVQVIVDVGGGNGAVSSSIVARYPSIKAVNFDLPHVIAMAPSYPGVEHISGDMFDYIPKGDTIFLKWTLHAFNDEKCIKVLENCHKVLPKNGKVIIMEAVLCDVINNGSSFDNVQIALDMVMMVYTLDNGKERRREEWEHILGAAKFCNVRVFELPCAQCIIEAFPIFGN